MVCTRRLSVAAVINASASALSASGPSLASGPSSPGASTHQPALRCFPNSLTRIDGRSSMRKRTTAPRGFVALGGASTSTRPPCERCSSTRRPPPSSITTYFPTLATRSIAAPGRSVARGTTVFNDENCSTSAPRSLPPAATSCNRSPSARTSGSSGRGPPADGGPRLTHDRGALVDAVGVRSVRHDADPQPVLPTDQRRRQEHTFGRVDPLEELAVGRLVAAPDPERDDGELRLPADLDRGVRGKRRVRALRQVELLIECTTERGHAVQRQRPPHAQPSHVARELGRELVVVREVPRRRKILQVGGSLVVRVPHRGPVAHDQPAGAVREEQSLMRVQS